MARRRLRANFTHNVCLSQIAVRCPVTPLLLTRTQNHSARFIKINGFCSASAKSTFLNGLKYSTGFVNCWRDQTGMFDQDQSRL
jgi:hypothetical protein